MRGGLHPSTKTDNFAELVCSNSLRGDALTKLPVFSREGMRRLIWVILGSAATRVPAGGALCGGPGMVSPKW